MREIAYFMLEPRAGEALSSRLGSRALRWETPRLERFLWRGYRVSLYLFPCRLEGTKRLRWWMERIGSALEEQGTVLCGQRNQQRQRSPADSTASGCAYGKEYVVLG